MSRLFEETLQQASYNGVIFPFSEAPSAGGHDGVGHRALLRRGEDQQPTGQKAYSGTFVIPFLTDLDPEYFPNRYSDLILALEANAIGTLCHPTKGTFRAFMHEWHEGLTADVQNGVILHLSWKEHRGEASTLVADSQRVPQNGSTVAESQAAQADANLISNFGSQPTGANANAALVLPVISAQLAFLESAGRTYAEVTSAIRVMTNAVENNLSLPVLQSPTQAAHDTVVSLEQLRGTIRQIRDVYQPQASRVRLFTVPSTMALWEVCLLALGDAMRDDLILPANSIPDPAAIPGGTVLTILPDE